MLGSAITSKVGFGGAVRGEGMGFGEACRGDTGKGAMGHRVNDVC